MARRLKVTQIEWNTLLRVYCLLAEVLEERKIKRQTKRERTARMRVMIMTTIATWTRLL